MTPFDEGCKAYDDNIHYEQNPYREDTVEWDQWDKGWTHNYGESMRKLGLWGDPIDD